MLLFPNLRERTAIPPSQSVLETMNMEGVVQLTSPFTEGNQDFDLSDDDPEVQKLAEELEFVFTKAITKTDEQKYVLDENKLIEKGFSQEEINGIIQLVAYFNKEKVPDLNMHLFQEFMKDNNGPI